MDDSYIQLRVVYTDLPDLIELGVAVQYRGWSASSKAYTSPTALVESARGVLRWVSQPTGRVLMEAGANTGIGWVVLAFYTIDRACHARCAVKLATGESAQDSRPEETWRVEIEVATELGLIERFAQECIAMGSSFRGGARLIALPT